MLCVYNYKIEICERRRQMNQHMDKNNSRTVKSENGVTIFLAFTTLMLLIVSQNKEWSSSGFLWWGTVGLFMAAFVLSSGLKIYLDVKYTTWSASFLLICSFSIVWAIDSGLVVNSIKNLLVYFVILMLLCSSIRTREDIETIFKVIVLSVVFNSIYLLFNNTGILEQAKLVESGATRLGEEDGWNANGIGFMSSTAMLISLYFFKKTQKNHIFLFKN